jgi:hypothetical protein
MSQTRRLAAILAANVRRSASTAWASQGGQVGNAAFPPNEAIRGRTSYEELPASAVLKRKGGKMPPPRWLVIADRVACRRREFASPSPEGR